MVDFNANFGYNVRNYQKMQKMQFGNNIRTGLNSQNNMYSMNSSLFKLDGNFGNKNIFKGANNSQNFNFNGVNYDNAYAMLNSVGDSGDKNGGKKGRGINFSKIIGFAVKVGGMLDKGFEGLSKFGKMVGDAAQKAVKSLKNGINKLFGKKGADKAGGTANKALEDLKNAQDKETLTKALDGAKTEQQANSKQVTDAEKNQKAAKKGQVDAKKTSDASEKKLDEDNKQLDQDNQALGQAKDGVATAKKALDAATRGVASAEEKLNAAKSAATEDNPNTAAISAAEQEVQIAKEQEAKAKDDLAAAEKAQAEAEKKVDAQTNVVKNSETENKKSQDGLKQADNELKTSEQNVNTVQTEGKKISEGVEDGNQRLEQMNDTPTPQSPVETPAAGSDLPSSVPPASVNAADNSSGKDKMPAIGNPGDDLQVNIANSNMDSAGLNAEQREQMISTYNQINNLQPGQSVVIDGTTYAKGNDGEITSENAMGKRTISDGKDGLNAGAIVVGENSRKIKLQKEDEEFVELYEKDQKKAGASADTPKPETKSAEQRKAETPTGEKKPEVDNTKPGAKWSKTISYSGNGVASREKISYERNADNTITEHSVRGTRILDEDGKTPIKEKSKNGGLNHGSVEIDYKAGTKTTDISSMKGSESAGGAVTKAMEKNGGTVLDKDGNAFLTYKDGEFYNAKGKKVKPDKAYDMINKHKDDGIRYRQNIKKR